jgi:hypothetical protein
VAAMFHFNLPQPPDYISQAEEVIRELDKKSHLLMRIQIIGPYFPHHAAELFVRIIDSQGNTTESWFTEIPEDNRRLRRYFTNKFPISGHIEFGYGNTRGARFLFAISEVLAVAKDHFLPC